MPRPPVSAGLRRAARLNPERAGSGTRVDRRPGARVPGLRALSLGLALLLALTACAATPGSATPGAAPALPAGVTLQLAQLRADVASRQAQVQVTNASGAPIEVGAVRIEDPRFAGHAARVMEGRVSTVAAGSSVDIRVQLAPVDCSAPDEGEAEVVLELLGDSGPVEVTASAPDPLGFVAELHARECLLERVTDAAALAFTGFEPSAPGAPASLELTVTPTGRAAVTVVGIARTNLIDFGGPASEEVRALGIDVAQGDSEPVVVQIPIVPFRCDPHAVQEDKRGTIFDLPVELAGESGSVELFVGEEMRGRILTWVADWCGLGG